MPKTIFDSSVWYDDVAVQIPMLVLLVAVVVLVLAMFSNAYVDYTLVVAGSFLEHKHGEVKDSWSTRFFLATDLHVLLLVLSLIVMLWFFSSGIFASSTHTKIASGLAVAVLMIILAFRSLAVKHLNVYFVAAGLFLLVGAALAAYQAWKHYSVSTVGVVVSGIVALLLLLTSFFMFYGAYEIQTGDNAEDLMNGKTKLEEELDGLLPAGAGH
jgi:hypothetical protein